MLKYVIVMIFSILIHSSTWSQKWDGIGIGATANGTEYKFMYADTTTNLLYIGGWEVEANNVEYSGIVVWDGTSFNSVGTGLNVLHAWTCGSEQATTCCAINYKNDLYVGGKFHLAGEDTVNNIARWDGSDWHSLGQGLDGIVRCFAVKDDTLFVGGTYGPITGSSLDCNGIAKWDGVSWHSVSNMDTSNFITISDMKEYNDELYVGGTFTLSINDGNIAKLIGNQWLSVGGGMQGNMDDVSCLDVYNGELFAAGCFSQLHGNLGNFIAKWDGNQWSEVGGGVEGQTPSGNGQIHGMCVFDDELWVGGVFSFAGGVPAKYMAKWDGEKWCAVEKYVNNRVRFFAEYNNDLYVGGGFTSIGCQPIPYIAKWTGGSYVDTCSTPDGVFEIEREEKCIVFPNPASSTLCIKTDRKIKSYSIYNITGQLIESDKYEGGISVAKLPPGIYVLLFSIGNENRITKFVKK